MSRERPQPQPFKFTADPEALSRLRARLTDPIYPPDTPTDSSKWQYGTDKSTLVNLVNYWRDEFDWRAQEARIFEFSHYKLLVNDIDLHFIHERSSRPDAIPLVFVHGWPGAFWEAHKIIRSLCEPEDPTTQAFHVVVPSLPGFGFSSVPQKKGFGIIEIAKTINQLMLALGYNRYSAQGGDWGAVICRQLGLAHSKHCKAIHVNMCIAPPPLSLFHPFALFRTILGAIIGFGWAFSSAEAEDIENTQDFEKTGTAYHKIHESKPQSLSYGLSDSPVGLLAWILEKFNSWTYHPSPHTTRDGLPPTISKDDFLTIVTIYYLTNTIGSSVRLYHEFSDERTVIFSGKVAVPTGVALFKRDIYKFPREWANIKYNIQSWSRFDQGGHFAALEEPELLLADVRQFNSMKIVKSQFEKSSSKL